MVTVQDGDAYFAQVLHNSEWESSDLDTKTRALATAERQILRLVPLGTIIPDEAVYEQAITLLRVDDGFLKAQLGVKSTAVKGISITYDLDSVQIIQGLPVSNITIAILRESGVPVGSRTGRYKL